MVSSWDPLTENNYVRFVLFLHRPEESSTLEMDFEHPEMLILPPPDVYADLTVE